MQSYVKKGLRRSVSPGAKAGTALGVIGLKKKVSPEKLRETIKKATDRAKELPRKESRPSLPSKGFARPKSNLKEFGRVRKSAGRLV